MKSSLPCSSYERSICTAALLAALAVWGALSARPASARRSGPSPTARIDSQHLLPRESGPARLAEGETLREVLVGGEARVVSVTLAAGQYAQVVFQWRGVDLDATLLGPDGRRAEGPVTQITAPGPTSVSILAGVKGEYRLEVRPAEELKINGRFEVRLVAVRQPTAADELRIQAERALAEGHNLRPPPAKEKLEEALRLWRSAGDAEGEAAALHALAEMYRRAGELGPANENYEAAAALRQKMRDPAAEAYTLLDRGRAVRDLSSPEKGLPSFERALSLFRDAGDRTGESAALYHLGFALARAAKYREAIRFYEEALAIQRADGDRLREARTLTAMGGAYDPLDEYDRALTCYQQAAPIRIELGDRLGGAIVLNNINVLNEKWGDWQTTKENYESALSAYGSLLKNGLSTCEVVTSELEGRICGYAGLTIHNLGELYNTLGDPQAALEKFEQSLKIYDALNQPRGKGLTRARMCYSKLLLDKPLEALALCTEALSLQRQGVDPPGLAYTYVLIGMVYDRLGQGGQALVSYDSALRSHTESGDLRGQALTLDKAGEAHARAGDVGKAREKFGLALRLWQGIKDHDGEAITLYKLAHAERAAGNLPEAHARITRALDIVESLRANVTSQRLRASYFAQKLDYYELAVDLKMQLAKAGGLGVGTPAELSAAAFQANERARARVLNDILLEARVDLRDSSDPALNELFRRRRGLLQRLNYKAAQQTRLLAGKASAEQLAAAEKEVSQLANEYDDVEAQVRARSPRYAGLTRPQPATLDEIQRQLLDEKTLLLEYALSDQRSYLWVISHSGVKSFELRKRAEIEDAALRVADILQRQQRQQGELAAAYQWRLAKLSVEFGREAEHLSRMVLGPAASELSGKRLLVVADGGLQLVPFAALPTPVSAAGGRLASSSKTAPGPARNQAHLLADGHEVVNLPSASTLLALRNMTRGRPPTPKSVAVLADPVFDQADARLQSALKGEAYPAAPPRALEDAELSRGAGLPRLMASRKEARSIVAAAPAGTATAALDFDANGSTATSSELGQHRYVHFATHGVFNDRQPALSGVVLSLFDASGKPREDGFLRLHDIYNLNLPVEMVVLSACQTGLGKQVRGEGLVGLTRGFMYAGAQRVVASLWKVDDEATAELMNVFYEHMLQGGISPPAALREAQLAVRRQRRWAAPYFWAGFVLQGEWK